MNNSARPGAGSDWWQTMFDTDWIKIYAYKNRETRREASALKQLLGLPPGSKILDVCCGDGRISLALARLGYQITGLDYSSSLLAKAAGKASRAGLDIEWIRKDMREIGADGEYDAAVNIFTSFGYFPDETDDLKALQSINRALKKDGKLVLDIENIFFLSRAAQIAGGDPMYRPIDNYRAWLEEVTDFDPVEQRVNMSLWLWFPEKERVKTGQASYRAYTPVEIRKLLKKAGFTIQNLFGDFALNPYTLESERMIMLCVKSISEAP